MRILAPRDSDLTAGTSNLLQQLDPSPCRHQDLGFSTEGNGAVIAGLRVARRGRKGCWVPLVWNLAPRPTSCVIWDN